MTDLLAIITIMLIPLVPLFWIPVHGLSRLFKRLGIFTYVTPFITWLPVAWIIYMNRAFLLQYKLALPLLVQITGGIIFIAGVILQLWTLSLLGVWGIVGLPEVTEMVESNVVTAGPFSVVRHPTYLSHTIMFAGVFLISGVITLVIIMLIDLIIINIVVIPLEDRELVARFGDVYERYREKVPAFFPRIGSI